MALIATTLYVLYLSAYLLSAEELLGDLLTPHLSVDDRRGLMPRLSRRRFCRRCGAEIATANLMDIDPGVDRKHLSLVLEGGRRRQLSPAEWRLFTTLYQRHGRIVPLAELTRATGNAESSLRQLILHLRRKLLQSRFVLLTHHAHGYELIVRGRS
jgi:DNA-binding response OmpR family regulator